MLSGSGGWDKAATDRARHIAASGAIVVGVAYPALRRHAVRTPGCWYVASDLELISHAAQKTLRLPQYHPPVIVGDAASAPVVYAALAGGPAVTFRGGVSIDFCPELRAARDV